MLFVGKDVVLNCCLPLIFSKRRYMGMRLAIALIPHKSNIQKALMIYITAFPCIFFKL